MDLVRTASPWALLASWLLFGGLLAVNHFRVRRQRRRQGIPEEKPAIRDPRSMHGLLLEGFSFLVAFLFAESPSKASNLSHAASIFFSVLCIAILAAALRHLGLQWRIKAVVTDDHQLITTGPYAFVRHPVFASLFCLLLATVLILTRTSAAFFSLVVCLIGTEIRIRAEDGLLERRFGAHFTDYQSRVPACIPFLRAFALFVLITSSSVATAADRVILVHDTPEPMTALAAGLKRHGFDVTLYDQETLRKHKDSLHAVAIFHYIHNRFDLDIERWFIDWTRRGGRLIVLHHGMASGKMSSPLWPAFMGVRILPRDDPHFPWKVFRGRFSLVNLLPGHYITTHNVPYQATVQYTPSDNPSTGQALPAIVFPDTEIFHNQLFTDARSKTILYGMKGETTEGPVIQQDRGAWMVPSAKGWVFYFQPGHFARDFENSAYLQVLVNAIRWSPR